MNAAELKQIANDLRLTAVEMVYKGKDGHPGVVYCRYCISIIF